MKWIYAFLCFRQQRVAVNGVKSDWAPVMSGVPQGTVLGPLLFSLHINDIMSEIESEIRLFADDCVCNLHPILMLKPRTNQTHKPKHFDNSI